MLKKYVNKLNTRAAAILLGIYVAVCVLPVTVSAEESNLAEWTIGIYMCGTDLESEGGAATTNLLQMIDADIPDNVNLLVLTGGTKTWDPTGEGVGHGGGYVKPDSEQTQLWKINNDGMALVKNTEQQMDMSSPDTLTYFTKALFEDYPSKRVMLTLWDHGSGPLRGVINDEYTLASMSIPMLMEALDESIRTSGGKKIDILGFDACLMSSFEIASCLAAYADYMLASAELEPSEGWQYYYWLNDLWEANGDMDAEALGRVIIDSFAYAENSSGDWTQVKELTLALIDLSKMGELLQAFDEMAFELSTEILSDDELYAKVLRQAENVDNMYEPLGLLDLYDFAYSVSPYLDSAAGIMKAVGKPPGSEPQNFVGDVAGGAVVYRGTGYVHSTGAGLTFYYPTSRTLIGTSSREQTQKASAVYRNLNVSDFYSVYLYNTLSAVNKLQEFSGEMVVGRSDSNYYLKIDDPIAIKKVVYMTTQRFEREDGSFEEVYLGEDPTDNDWAAGIFTDNFDGKWASLDGEICTMDVELMQDEPGYVCLSVPVLVDDDEDISLMTIYLEVDENYKYTEGAYINSIMDVSGDGETSRTYRPEKDTKIYTLLAEFDSETGGFTGGHTKNPKPLSFIGEEDGCFLVDFGIADLMSGQDYLTICYFKATDVRGNEFVSEPCYYIIINDLKEMTVEPIADQPYSGREITPKVRLTFRGMDDVLTEGREYKVEYVNNINRGRAKAVVTPIVDDLTGTLEIYFYIR